MMAVLLCRPNRPCSGPESSTKKQQKINDAMTKPLPLSLAIPTAWKAEICSGPRRAATAQSPGESVTPNFEHAIPNIPGKSPIAVVVDYALRGASRSHTHAKSAFVYAYVVSGAIESQGNDGPKRVYHAGESFYELPGAHHSVSRNASTTGPTLVELAHETKPPCNRSWLVS
jgi:quercetin dioxygenase-like cupin family protein